MPFVSQSPWGLAPEFPVTPYPWRAVYKKQRWRAGEQVDIVGSNGVVADEPVVATIPPVESPARDGNVRLILAAPFLLEAAANLLSKREQGTVGEEDYLRLEWAYFWGAGQTEDSYETVLESFRRNPSSRVTTSEKYYTPRQVAELLQIRVETVYDYIKQGKLPASRFGNRYRVSEIGLDRFVKDNLADEVDAH